MLIQGMKQLICIMPALPQGAAGLDNFRVLVLYTGQQRQAEIDYLHQEKQRADNQNASFNLQD